MKKQNLRLIAIIILLALLLVAALYKPLNKYVTILSYIVPAVFVLDFLLRRKSWFKPYVTNKYNPTEKFFYNKEIDLSKELLFEKLTEVLGQINFKIVKTDKQSGDIFATTPMSWASWGENIYIHLEEEKDKTLVNFCSASFQLYTWGKNKRNYDNLINQFEKSLII